MPAAQPPAASTPGVPAELSDPRLRGIPAAELLMVLPYATPDELLAARSAGLGLLSYAAARDLGTSHDDALAAHAVGADVSFYAQVRGAGDTHEEALRGLATVPSYRRWRPQVRSHDDVVLAHAAGLTALAATHLTEAVADLARAGVPAARLQLALQHAGGNWSRLDDLRDAAEDLAGLDGADQQTWRVARALLAAPWRGPLADLPAVARATSSRPAPPTDRRSHDGYRHGGGSAAPGADGEPPATDSARSARCLPTNRSVMDAYDYFGPVDDQHPAVEAGLTAASTDADIDTIAAAILASDPAPPPFDPATLGPALRTWSDDLQVLTGQQH